MEARAEILHQIRVITDRTIVCRYSDKRLAIVGHHGDINRRANRRHQRIHRDHAGSSEINGNRGSGNIAGRNI